MRNPTGDTPKVLGLFQPANEQFTTGHKTNRQSEQPHATELADNIFVDPLSFVQDIEAHKRKDPLQFISHCIFYFQDCLQLQRAGMDQEALEEMGAPDQLNDLIYLIEVYLGSLSATDLLLLRTHCPDIETYANALAVFSDQEFKPVDTSKNRLDLKEDQARAVAQKNFRVTQGMVGFLSCATIDQLFRDIEQQDSFDREDVPYKESVKFGTTQKFGAKAFVLLSKALCGLLKPDIMTLSGDAVIGQESFSGKPRLSKRHSSNDDSCNTPEIGATFETTGHKC